MKPSKAFKDKRSIVSGIFSRYPMFSNIRITGSVDRMEDDEQSDLDLYLDADSSATLLDIARLEDELSEALGFPVDIFSSNMCEAKYLSKIYEGVI